jgi:hypothetical protein
MDVLAAPHPFLKIQFAGIQWVRLSWDVLSRWGIVATLPYARKCKKQNN